MDKLIIEDDEGKTTVVPLIRDEITIGRKEGNTIRLTERNVSRRHARLCRENGAVFIEDLGSYNGVKVNGQRVGGRAPMTEGEVFLIGDYKLSVRLMQTAAAASGSPSAGANAAKTMAGRAASAGGAPPTVNGTPVEPAVAAMPPPPPPVAEPAIEPPHLPLTGDEPAAHDGAPTVPVRTLDAPAAEPAQAPAQVAAPAARLVILTTDRGGSEFILDRPSHVIGRTDENDVVVSHRSISRHHAKILREGERYTIVDLQSANGVRVNGSSYERVELTAGDMIELGHVRLRFVGPRETFTWDPSLAGGRRSRLKPIAIVSGVFAATILTAVIVLSGPTKPKSKLIEAPTAGTSVVATAPIPSPVAAPPPRAPTVVTPTTTAAAAPAAPAASAAPSPAPAADDTKSADAFARFQQSADSKSYDEALVAWSEIADDSPFKDRGRAAYRKVRAGFIDKHLATAEKLRQQGQCADAEREAGMVFTVDEKNKPAREVVKLCRPRPEASEATAAATRREHREPRAQPTAAVAKESPAQRASASTPAVHHEEPTTPAADPQALVKQAREAWVRGQHAAAIDAARKALRAKPGYTDAYLIIAVASCSLRDSDGATKAYTKLDDKMKGMVKSSCQKNGITLE